MAHVLYGYNRGHGASESQDGVADVDPDLHCGPPLVSHEAMMKEINEATKRELLLLEKKLKGDTEIIDRTVHFRRQFFTTATFRLHMPTWIDEITRIVMPLRFLRTGTDKRSAWLIIALWSLLMSYLVVGILNFMGASALPEVLAQFFEQINVFAIDFWTPVIFYLIFGIVVATQSSIWTMSSAADQKRFRKLEHMKILHYDPVGRSAVTLDARDVALGILRKGVLFKSDLTHLWKTVAISACISALYLSIPVIYARFSHSSAASATHGGLASLLATTFKFSLSTLVLTELGTSLLNLYERLVLLKVFTDITSKKRSTKRHLPFIKLYTPENIVCWQFIRQYTLAHHEARLVWFQVLTAFGASYVAFVSLNLALRFWFRDPFGLADLQGFFVLIVGGIYTVIVIFIGAMVDTAQKSHLKVLLKQKWKLQRHLMKYDEGTDIPARKLNFDDVTSAKDAAAALLFEQDDGGVSDDSEFDSDGSFEDTSPAGSKGKKASQMKTPPPKKVSSSFLTPPSAGRGNTLHAQDSPLSPIALTTPLKGREREIAEECQKLLSRLIKVMRETDKPLYLLGVVKVDSALAVKVTGILASVLISRIRGLFSTK